MIELVHCDLLFILSKVSHLLIGYVYKETPLWTGRYLRTHSFVTFFFLLAYVRVRVVELYPQLGDGVEERL